MTAVANPALRKGNLMEVSVDLRTLGSATACMVTYPVRMALRF
jgi:hypothetical protein